MFANEESLRYHWSNYTIALQLASPLTIMHGTSGARVRISPLLTAGSAGTDDLQVLALMTCNCIES